MNINELMNKPLWQMTGEEFLAIINEKKPAESAPAPTDREINPSKYYVYGLAGKERRNRQGYHPVWPQDYR